MFKKQQSFDNIKEWGVIIERHRKLLLNIERKCRQE